MLASLAMLYNETFWTNFQTVIFNKEIHCKIPPGSARSRQGAAPHKCNLGKLAKVQTCQTHASLNAQNVFSRH